MILNQLKAETRVAHERIERDLRLAERTTTRPLCRALLARFYGFHAAWEPEAEAIIADPGFFDARRKVPLLVADLRVLGASSQEIENLPLCRPVVPMPTRASALGAMYVVEGSTLGGSLIARQVQRALGMGPDDGCAYFGSYGRDVGRMWKAFGVHLTAASNPVADKQMIVAAQETFEIMRAWLCDEATAT